MKVKERAKDYFLAHSPFRIVCTVDGRVSKSALVAGHIKPHNSGFPPFFKHNTYISEE